MPPIRKLPLPSFRRTNLGSGESLLRTMSRWPLLDACQAKRARVTLHGIAPGKAAAPGVKCPLPSPKNVSVVTTHYRHFYEYVMSALPSSLTSPILAFDDVSETFSSGTISNDRSPPTVSLPVALRRQSRATQPMRRRQRKSDSCACLTLAQSRPYSAPAVPERLGASGQIIEQRKGNSAICRDIEAGR